MNAVEAHYTQPGLRERVREALRESGLNPDRLSQSELDKLDQFHVGGLDATVSLARLAGIRCFAPVFVRFGATLRLLLACWGRLQASLRGGHARGPAGSARSMPAMRFDIFSRTRHADKLADAFGPLPACSAIASTPTIKRHHAEPVVRARRRHCSRFF